MNHETDIFIPESWRGKPVLKIDELLEGVPFNRDEIYRMAKAGQMPSRKIGGRRLFPTRKIIEWLEVA